MKYQHLSLEERVELYSQLNMGVSLREIAKELGRSHTSLSRELKRHTRYGRAYKPVLANKRAIKWAKSQRYKAPLKGVETLSYVLEKLRLGWSPGIIAGRIKIDKPNLSISHESIYSWIYDHKGWKRRKLWKHLEQGHKKRRKRLGRRVSSYTQVLDTKSIDLRPDYINSRSSIGHGETDLMESGRDSSAALSVTVDRLSRIVCLTKVKDKSSKSKNAAIQKTAPFGTPWLSMTADRGSENKGYQSWEEKMGSSVFFCHAYHSWEKGSVENTIKRVRRFIPKGSDVAKYNWREIKKIEWWINNRPMKCLQYLTPYEKMQAELVKQNANLNSPSGALQP